MDAILRRWDPEAASAEALAAALKSRTTRGQFDERVATPEFTPASRDAALVAIFGKPTASSQENIAGAVLAVEALDLDRTWIGGATIPDAARLKSIYESLFPGAKAPAKYTLMRTNITDVLRAEAATAGARVALQAIGLPLPEIKERLRAGLAAGLALAETAPPAAAAPPAVRCVGPGTWQSSLTPRAPAPTDYPGAGPLEERTAEAAAAALRALTMAEAMPDALVDGTGEAADLEAARRAMVATMIANIVVLATERERAALATVALPAAPPASQPPAPRPLVAPPAPAPAPAPRSKRRAAADAPRRVTRDRVAAAPPPPRIEPPQQETDLDRVRRLEPLAEHGALYAPLTALMSEWGTADGKSLSDRQRKEFEEFALAKAAAVDEDAKAAFKFIYRWSPARAYELVGRLATALAPAIVFGKALEALGVRVSSTHRSTGQGGDIAASIKVHEMERPLVAATSGLALLEVNAALDAFGRSHAYDEKLPIAAALEFKHYDRAGNPDWTLSGDSLQKALAHLEAAGAALVLTASTADGTTVFFGFWPGPLLAALRAHVGAWGWPKLLTLRDIFSALGGAAAALAAAANALDLAPPPSTRGVCFAWREPAPAAAAALHTALARAMAEAMLRALAGRGLMKPPQAHVKCKAGARMRCVLQEGHSGPHRNKRAREDNPQDGDDAQHLEGGASAAASKFFALGGGTLGGVRAAAGGDGLLGAVERALGEAGAASELGALFAARSAPLLTAAADAALAKVHEHFAEHLAAPPAAEPPGGAPRGIVAQPFDLQAALGALRSNAEGALKALEELKGTAEDEETLQRVHLAGYGKRHSGKRGAKHDIRAKLCRALARSAAPAVTNVDSGAGPSIPSQAPAAARRPRPLLRLRTMYAINTSTDSAAYQENAKANLREVKLCVEAGLAAGLAIHDHLAYGVQVFVPAAGVDPLAFGYPGAGRVRLLVKKAHLYGGRAGRYDWRLGVDKRSSAVSCHRPFFPDVTDLVLILLGLDDAHEANAPAAVLVPVDALAARRPTPHGFGDGADVDYKFHSTTVDSEGRANPLGRYSLAAVHLPNGLAAEVQFVPERRAARAAGAAAAMTAAPGRPEAPPEPGGDHRRARGRPTHERRFP